LCIPMCKAALSRRGEFLEYHPSAGPAQACWNAHRYTPTRYYIYIYIYHELTLLTNIRYLTYSRNPLNELTLLTNSRYSRYSTSST
jgi:hypothetical protein